ncbi:MAG: DUF4242 domain-containing protein [Acidimicrobiia bacterium]
MPLFLIERSFAEELDDATLDTDGINAVNEEEGVEWIYSFLSADKRKTYCLYEAPSAEAIRAAAVRAGLPADSVVEVIAQGMPDGSLRPIPVS